MTALTTALVVTDHETIVFSDRAYRSSRISEKASDFFQFLGEGGPQFGLAGGFAAFGFVFNDHRALRTASQLTQAILACGTVVQVIKHATGRESPFLATSSTGTWRLLPNQIEYHRHVPKYDAFPSGHIATALATVTVVAENYPEWTWVKPVGYTIVGLIGVAMANTGIHWYSDYPLGLFLGYSFGMLASHPEGWRPSSPESHIKVSILPTMVPEGAGLGVQLTF